MCHQRSCTLLSSYGVGDQGRLHHEEHREKPGRAELASSLRHSNKARSVMGHPSMTEVAGWHVGSVLRVAEPLPAPALPARALTG